MNLKNIRRAWGVVAIAAACGLNGIASAQEAAATPAPTPEPVFSAETADEVIKMNIEASGGEAAMLALKNVSRKAEVSVDGAFGMMEGTSTSVVVPWEKAYTNTDLGAFIQSSGWNGEAAWADGMMGLTDVDTSSTEFRQLEGAAALNPFVKMKDDVEVVKLADHISDDAEHWVIQTTGPDGQAVHIHVDKASKLIGMIVLPDVENPMFGTVNITIMFDDYNAYGGVQFADSQSMTAGEMLDMATDYTETTINGDIDESIFDKPQPPAPPAPAAPASQPSGG